MRPKKNWQGNVTTPFLRAFAGRDKVPLFNERPGVLANKSGLAVFVDNFWLHCTKQIISECLHTQRRRNQWEQAVNPEQEQEQELALALFHCRDNR